MNHPGLNSIFGKAIRGVIPSGYLLGEGLFFSEVSPLFGFNHAYRKVKSNH